MSPHRERTPNSPWLVTSVIDELNYFSFLASKIFCMHLCLQASCLCYCLDARHPLQPPMFEHLGPRFGYHLERLLKQVAEGRL